MGTAFTQETIDLILQMLEPDHVKGLTLLGGEPFEPQNQPSVLNLLQQMKKKFPQKTVWAFSGYLFDKDILAGRLGNRNITNALLEYVDVLVDGPFVEAQKDLMLRFRGSSNQRIIDVRKSLLENTIVLWEDWQGQDRGIK